MSAGLPLLVLATSLATGLAIFFVGEHRYHLRSLLNLAGAGVKVLLVLLMLWGVAHEEHYELRYTLLPGVDFALRADALGLLFLTLSSGLWLLTTVYAIGYLEGSPQRSRFFGFFSLCITATTGIALAGNLLTFFIFYELLTLVTYPLVVHRGTERSLHAGRVYLAYTLAGGAVLLVGLAWLQSLLGNIEFTTGGLLAQWPGAPRETLTTIFVLLIAGFGVKAALVPLHGWLPVAMAAPAPVSALLHAVAVVKAGAFGIMRVVYDVYGVEYAANLGLLLPLAVAASLTIVYGSLRAMRQDDLKKRLAFSTVSQVSYIVLGVALFGPVGAVGGLVHLVHQGIMKITLFFCAGNLGETLGIHRVSEMDGVGRRMPWTMAAFTVAAFGMIGVPPMAGFISKWHLGLGALDAHMPWVLGVLVASGLLNAAYLLPILHAAWFKGQQAPWPAELPRQRFEATGWLLWPPVVTALLTVAVGLFAAAPFTPLDWARLIALKLYLQ